MESTGGSSSSTIVPVAVPSSSVAPPGLLSVTVNVSSGSSVSSSVVCTSMVFRVSPGSNVSVSASPS